MSSRNGPLWVLPGFTSEPSCCAAVQLFVLAALMVRANVPSTCCLAGKAYLCMGQLDEADSQYKRALELEPGSAAIKGEAQLVDVIRSNLRMGRECLEAGDPRYPLTHLPLQKFTRTQTLYFHNKHRVAVLLSLAMLYGHLIQPGLEFAGLLRHPACHAVTDYEFAPRQVQILPV